MKYLRINTGESRWSRSWKALQLHLPNTGKMNDRANIAENVVLATDLLLINTKLPSNPPYISLSAHTPQCRPAQTPGKEKDHQDLASIPQAAPPAGHFSQLPPWRTRAFLPPALPAEHMDPFLEQSLQQRGPTGVLVRGLEWFSSNKIK